MQLPRVMAAARGHTSRAVRWRAVALPSAEGSSRTARRAKRNISMPSVASAASQGFCNHATEAAASAVTLQRRMFSISTSPAPAGPLQRYRSLVDSGEITFDNQQEVVVSLLDDVCKRVTQYRPIDRSASIQQPAAPVRQKPQSGGGWLSTMFSGSSAPAAKKIEKAAKEAPRLKPVGPKGLYVWGGCGTGKTFLMDLFYETVPVDRKKRIHFHEWMIDVHERLHRFQKESAMVQEKANTVWTAEAAKAQREQLKDVSTSKASSADDLVSKVAAEMMGEAWLLCFDEFQVTHISDAIIMKRLFSVLFQRGAVVIATSNRPPEDLYLNGLNRPLFLPFIPMIKDFCDVHDIASSYDYRMATTGEDDDKRLYIYPNGREEAKLLERKFYRLSRSEVATGVHLELQGRRISVPKTAQHSNVAWFRFKDLCDKPLGAADYLAIGSQFHTVFIADIPRLTLQERDQVRRFITLIDAFYERHTKLICTADEDPISLFYVSEADRQSSTADEIFAWDRTVSRLMEMQSVKYISDVSRTMPGEQFLGQFDLRQLQEDDVEELWRRYDVDDNGTLDTLELRVMFEDLIELDKGHRSLSDRLHKAYCQALDVDKDGLISYKDFNDFFSDFDAAMQSLAMIEREVKSKRNQERAVAAA